MARKKASLNIDVPADWEALVTWPNFFYAQQKEFVSSETFQTWFIAGNGTGKTLLICWSMVALALGIHPKQPAPPPLRITALVPSFDFVEDVHLDKLMRSANIEPYNIEVPPLCPGSMVKKPFHKREHRQIDFVNGSFIAYVSTEQGWQAHRGREHDILVIDEEPSDRVFDENLRGLRNARGGGRVIAGLTPPVEEGQGPTWTKERIVEHALVDEDLTVVNACMMDNPAITPKFVKEFSKGKTKRQLDTQLYGKHPTWGDLVHPDFRNTLWNADEFEGHLLPNDTPMPEAYEVDWVMAFDWHPSKPCAAVWGWVDRDGNLIIFDELDKEVARGKTIDELSDIFHAIEGYPHSKRKFRRWQDPSAKSAYQAVQRGFNAWDAFRQVGIVTSAGKNRDPLIGIGIVNEYFAGNGKEHPRVFLFERCKNTIHSLNNHYWKRGEDGIGKPDPKWSDYPICIRYILQEVAWKERVKKKRNWPLVSYKGDKVGRQRTTNRIRHVAHW